jgi:hypothetical protein
MVRHRLWSLLGGLAILGAFSLLAACSSDPEDRPPRAEIVYPEPGYHYTSAPDSVVVDAVDDRAVMRVEIRFDGRLLSTRTTRPYSTRLPLGLYADGRPHELRARAYDGRGQTGDAAPITVTIDPQLQTVPQITALGPPAGLDDPPQGPSLRLAWLPWPHPLEHFAWELARDEDFTVNLAAGTTADTVVTVPVTSSDLAYARVRAVGADEASGWSRTARHSGLQTWRRHHPLAGPQLGAAITAAPDGELRILSHAVARHQVARASVQLLTVTPAGDLLATSELLAEQQPLTASLFAPDGRLYLAGMREDGGAQLAAASLAGELLWSVDPGFMHTTALAVADDGAVLVFGADRREDRPGGVIGTVAAGGTVTELLTFPLTVEREVHQAWRRPGGGFVLAGPVAPDTDQPAGGIWAMGLDPTGEVLWNVRLGTSHRWLLRGSGAREEAGQYVLGGIAMRADRRDRYGFLVGLDQDGRVRWQVIDRNWHLFTAIMPDAGERWVATGARRRDIGDNQWEYDVALRGLTSWGTTLWEASHRQGRDTQGWCLLAHPDGGWYVGGTRSTDGSEYDVELLRVDDRGDLQ